MLRSLILIMAVIAIVRGENTSTESPKTQSLKKTNPSNRSSRTFWSSTPSAQQRYTYDGSSQTFGSWTTSLKGNSRQTTETYPNYSFSSQEYWNPSSSQPWITNYTNPKPNYYRPYIGVSGSSSSSSSTGGTSYTGYSNQDSFQGSHSMFQYQQVRPSSTKKIIPYHPKTQMYVKTAEKPKQKKTNPVLYYNPNVYKKTVYPRVHKPYAKLKYPAKKTVLPVYRRYYQSPYQQYNLLSPENFRFSVKKPTTQSDAYYRTTGTTERMDDTYEATSEDYSSYNDTHYDGYGESDLTSSTTTSPGSDDENYDESTTRNYYGDRIYMSTQVPVKISPETMLTKNRYYIIRRTSGDDIETIFE